jgi:hypothetical protein
VPAATAEDSVYPSGLVARNPESSSPDLESPCLDHRYRKSAKQTSDVELVITLIELATQGTRKEKVSHDYVKARPWCHKSQSHVYPLESHVTDMRAEKYHLITGKTSCVNV